MMAKQRFNMFIIIIIISLSLFFLFLSASSSSTITKHDMINSPTVFPTNPTTTLPVTSPPTTIMPTNPATNPVTVPATNPTTTYPPPTPESSVPAVVTAPPSVPGQSWCVARPGASQASLQAALDYACGTGGVDCSQLLQGGNCYIPNTIQNHASFAFNSYYQKNPSPQSCDFGGAAALVTINPSSGSCTYTSSSSSSSSSSSPTTPTIPTTTPTPSTQTVAQPAIPAATTPTGGGIIGSASPPIFNPANPLSNTPSNPSSGTTSVYGFDGSPTVTGITAPTPSESSQLQIWSDHAIIATLLLLDTLLLWN